MPNKQSPHAISFYFVLYLVAIVTVFVITMERDTLLRRRDEDIAHLVEIYVKPLKLAPAIDTARFFFPPSQTATSEPVKLIAKSEGPIDRNDIQYRLVEARRIESGSDEEIERGSVANDNGDAVLTSPPLKEGLYEFRVAGYKPRIIRHGSTMRVAIRDTTYSIQFSERLEHIDRDTTLLLASVTRSGLEPTSLALSSDRSRDTWVFGLPFSKRLFVGGVESPDRITFEAPGLRMERKPEERAFVTAVWDRPTLGPHEFTVHANANRGLGPKDHASTTFTVDVVPASFSTLPAGKAFWGIPYVFDGQIAGVNPLDLTVENFRNGQSLGTRPIVPKDTVVPNRTWQSLAFRVLYHGAPIKEHRVTLEPPPPPQIKWLSQSVDRARNVFIVTVNCSDPVGGAVRMSLESQPGGIARLDKMRGTSFTITIDLESKPLAVFVKLTALDQYGGQSVSTKQYNTQ